MAEAIIDHLDLWTSALLTKSTAGRGSNGKLEPYGVKKLRELILELAVRGKLVQQDHNDEPASVLLERIAQDKARLLAEGGGYKTPTMPEITDEETPFVIPSGWEWIRLGDLGPIFNGNSISERVKATKYTGNEGGLPFIATKDVGYGWQPLDYKNGVSIPEGEPNFKVAHQAAILICCEGGSAGKKCGITDRDICFGNKLYALEPLAGVSSHFLLANYLTPTFFAQFTAKMTGIIGGISLANFNHLLVPLPPVNEQHRIVAKVDELMALCDQLEQQQTDSLAAHRALIETLLGTLTRVESQQEFSAAWARIASHFDTLFTTEASIDQLKQTILQLAVAGKLSSAAVSDKPMSTLLEEIMIERKRVGATKKELEYFEEECQAAKKSVAKNRVMLKTRFFCAFITKGTTPASTELLQTGDVPFLKVYNIVSNRVDFDYKPTFISKEVHESKLKRSVLFPGDVIMNIVGPPLGKVAIVPEQYPEWNMNQALAVFRPMGGIYNRYLYYMLSSATVLKSVLADVKGTAGQDNLSLEQCRDLLVPMPSVEEQHRIVAKVDELMALCDALKARLADAQTTQLHLADAIVEQAVC